jgi:FtsZ-binding cell division protein ZapB
MTPNIADQIIATLHARIDELVAHVETLHYEVDAIPAIKEERDAALEQNTQLDKRCAKLEAERDAWVERHKACVKCLGEALQDTADSFVERDALAAAAKLALDSAVDVYATCDRYGDGDQKAMESLSKAIDALRQAGVQ